MTSPAAGAGAWAGRPFAPTVESCHRPAGPACSPGGRRAQMPCADIESARKGTVGDFVRLFIEADGAAGLRFAYDRAER